MTNNDVHHYAIPPHLTVEELGSEVVILDTTRKTTHRLHGDMAEVFLAIATSAPLPSHATRTIARLERLGLVTAPRGVTRRVMVAGAAAGGFTALALPHVAWATSGWSSLPVTTFGFDSAHADFRWEHSGTTLTIGVAGLGLKETDRFLAGETWTLTLTNADGKTATAPVVSAAGLTLTFSFPDTPAGSFPSSLTAQLSRNTGTEILQTPEFAIDEF